MLSLVGSPPSTTSTRCWRQFLLHPCNRAVQHIVGAGAHSTNGWTKLNERRESDAMQLTAVGAAYFNKWHADTKLARQVDPGAGCQCTSSWRAEEPRTRHFELKGKQLPATICSLVDQHSNEPAES